jgi:hypothetical protein
MKHRQFEIHKDKDYLHETVGLTMEEVDDLEIRTKQLAKNFLKKGLEIEDVVKVIGEEFSDKELVYVATSQFLDKIQKIKEELQLKRENDDCTCEACQLRRAMEKSLEGRKKEEEDKSSKDYLDENLLK